MGIETVNVVVKNKAEDFEAEKASHKCKNRLETKHFKTISGRGRRLRTLGLRFWRPPLYQLSYSPVLIFRRRRIRRRTIHRKNGGPSVEASQKLPAAGFAASSPCTKNRAPATVFCWFQVPLILRGSHACRYPTIKWWTVRDSNPGPTGYEPAALPTELTVQIPSGPIRKIAATLGWRQHRFWRPL